MNIIKHNWEWRHGLSSRKYTDAIVVHHAAAKTASAEQIHASHLQRDNGTWAGIGYHLYIRKDGSVHEGRPLWASGAHVLNHNYHTVGVCCEGNYDVETVMPAAQLNALREVLAYLKSVYPNAAIKRHKDFQATACPGRYFPFSEALNYAPEPAPAPVPTPTPTPTQPVKPAESEEEEMTYEQFKEYQERYEAETTQKAASGWAAGAAKRAILSGLFKDGNGDGLLDNPQAPVSREQLAEVLDRAGVLSAQDRFIARFDDLPEWAKPFMRKLLDAGIINGGTPEETDPDDIGMYLSDIRVLIAMDRMMMKEGA